MKYIDRKQAGLMLADLLNDYTDDKNTLILALPRGGVPVASEIARKLHLPLDVLIVRKLGVPGHEELAMGAIASGGSVVFNDDIISHLHINKTQIKTIIQSEQSELNRRERVYRGNKPPVEVKGKTVIIVDDGVATGSTMKSAILAVQLHDPSNIIVAIPVAAQSTLDELSGLVTRVVCPLHPEDFYAVGFWYEQFPQTSDEEVINLLSGYEKI